MMSSRSSGSTRCRAIPASSCSTGPSSCRTSRWSCERPAASWPRPTTRMRLLQQDRLVAVFPEGVKGAGKPFGRPLPPSALRSRRLRGGRAPRTGAPIVPVAIVGSEEIYPKLGEAPLLARLIGAPFFPLTPTFPWLGPLGVVPLPSKWRIEFCEPIETTAYGPEAAEDRALVLELSERVQGRRSRQAVREPREARAGVRLGLAPDDGIRAQPTSSGKCSTRRSSS